MLFGSELDPSKLERFHGEMIHFIFCLFLPLYAQFVPESYIESRDHFLELGESLQEKIPSAQIQNFSIPTQTKMLLTTDVLYLPQNGGETERLLIITSGTHGIEAFVGSALQFDFLSNYFEPSWLDHMGILIVHAVNPYGYQFKRRVNENNVDLNRNYSATQEHFDSRITAYKVFDEYLNPEEELNASYINDAVLFLQSLKKLFFYGRKQIAQIAVGGQYQNPKGIYYGGQKIQENVKVIEKVFKHFGNPYNKIVHIDLHTGYGRRGQLHFFSDRRLAEASGFKTLFKGFDLDFGADKDFYRTSGDFGTFSFRLFKEKEIIIPMTFEFGTLNSQTTLGGFRSLRNMIYENQGFRYGYADEASEKRVKELFKEMFNPSDPEWRKKVFRQAKESLSIIIDRFKNL